MIKPEEAAEWLGISVHTLHDWVSEKKIEFVRVSPKVTMFTMDALRRFRDERTVAPIGPRKALR